METNSLYPLSFKPIVKQLVWGSEDWVLSGVPGNVSVVRSGFLQRNSISELLEVYMADIVGQKAFDTYGEQFPLLFKYLHVNDRLSVQVHPNDALALKKHNSYGKTEMWYVVEAGPNARLYLGFNRDLSVEEFYARCQDETLPEVMNGITPHPGECYFIPAGLIHACGGGLTIAEVQQVSDITYRVYDWGREHHPATAREMHLDLAVQCINFKKYTPAPTTRGVLAKCPYFTTTLLRPTETMERENMRSDSFVYYLGVEGSIEVEYQNKHYAVGPREGLLIPAALEHWNVAPAADSPVAPAVLEVTL